MEEKLRIVKPTKEVDGDVGEEESVWVEPGVGSCIKFKGDPKTFVNFVTTTALPPPSKPNVSEDDLAEMISSSEANFVDYKIPLAVGDVEAVTDKKGESANAVDILINKEFFHSRVSNSDLFMGYLTLIGIDAIRSKYPSISLDPQGWTILKNRKYFGPLQNSQPSRQRIRRHPTAGGSQRNGKSLIQEVAPSKNDDSRPVGTQVKSHDQPSPKTGQNSKTTPPSSTAVPIGRSRDNNETFGDCSFRIINKIHGTTGVPYLHIECGLPKWLSDSQISSGSLSFKASSENFRVLLKESKDDEESCGRILSSIALPLPINLSTWTAQLDQTSRVLIGSADVLER